MNLYFNWEHQNSSLSPSSWKPSCYLSKIILKSNYKHADGVVHAQKQVCDTQKSYSLGK